MRFQKTLNTFVVVLSSFLVSACADFWEDNGDGFLGPFFINTINVYPASLTMTAVGESFQLQSRIKTSQNQTSTDTSLLVWRSSNESVVTVDGKGKLVSVGVGEATISANYADRQFDMQLVVNESGQEINGFARYEDQLYGHKGLTGAKEFKSLRHVYIELRDANDQLISSSLSDENGVFKFGKFLLDNYKISVWSKVDGSLAPGFIVQDMSKNIYVVSKYGAGGNTNYVDIGLESGISGAFNILDVMTSAAEFSRNQLGVDARDLDIFWEKNNYYGTYFCFTRDQFDCINGEGIYVLNMNSFGNSFYRDTDEFDDDVLMHEFGHYLIKRYGADDTPGGCHTLMDNNLDLRLAWSEGLGTFFPVAIKKWMRTAYPGRMSMLPIEADSLYVDTQYDSSLGNLPIISFDFNAPESNEFEEEIDVDAFHYASSEVAVLKILLEISNVYGMNRIWDVVENYFPAADYPTSLASFWDGIRSEGQMDLSTLQPIFNERKIFYTDDSFEPDNGVAGATAITVNASTPIDHYLYRTGGGLDVDVFAVDLVKDTRYQIETAELRNGIDTQLTLLDEFGDPVQVNDVVVTNDDAVSGRYYRFDEFCFGGGYRTFVDKDSLASAITFTPSSTGKYYIEVMHHTKFSYGENFTGHYGNYQLNVSETSL